MSNQQMFISYCQVHFYEFYQLGLYQYHFDIVVGAHIQGESEKSVTKWVDYFEKSGLYFFFNIINGGLL